MNVRTCLQLSAHVRIDKCEDGGTQSVGLSSTFRGDYGVSDAVRELVEQVNGAVSGVNEVFESATSAG